MESLTVQLIYSDGGLPRYEENLWYFYTIALTPFVLNVPAAQVELTLAPGFLGAAVDQLDRVFRDLVVDRSTPILPDEYRLYFQDIYARARSGEEAFPLPACSIRLITGHGFANFGGGNISIGRRVVRYHEIGSNATDLTILDISNSVYAVAHLEGNIPPQKQWHRFDTNVKANVFDNNDTVPVVCDKNEALWAFRVGFQGQNETEPSLENETDNLRMSRPVGDSVACSLLVAVKRFVDEGGSHSLDETFQQVYKSLRTCLLRHEHVLLPHSSLGRLEDLIRREIVHVKESAFHCPFFQNSSQWYLSMERALALTPEDGDSAAEIVRFVVDSVIQWFQKHPDDMGDDERDFSAEWQTLGISMGPFHRDLKQIRLSSDNNNHVVQSTDGVELEAWACACGALPIILAKVRRKIETGSFDDQEIHSGSVESGDG